MIRANRRRLAVVLGAAVVLGLAGLALVGLPGRRDARPRGDPPTTSAVPAQRPAAESADSRAPVDPVALPAADADSAALDAWLAGLPAGAEAERLLALWSRDRRRPLDGAFAIGPGGRLRSAGTVGEWILDRLGALDPEAARRLAREVLADPDATPGEVALALRALAWAAAGPRGPAADADPALVAEIVAFWNERRALAAADPAGAVAPAALETFDVAAWAGGPIVIGVLGREFADPALPRARSHAIATALDRLATRAPGDVLAALAADPAWPGRTERTRASLAARVDPADPAQASLLARYLAMVPASERAEFYLRFPNLNQTLTEGIVTAPMLLGPEEVRRRANEAEGHLAGWAEREADPAARAAIERARRRMRALGAP